MGIEINSFIHEIFIAAVHGKDTVLDCVGSQKVELTQYRQKCTSTRARQVYKL